MEPLPGIHIPPPHLDGPALVRRAAALLNRWVELYGEHNPQWLPPAGIVNWQEDASRFIGAHTLPAATGDLQDMDTEQHDWHSTLARAALAAEPQMDAQARADWTAK